MEEEDGEIDNTRGRGEDYKRIKTLLSFDMSETERKTSSRIIRDEEEGRIEEAIRRERGTE